MPMSRHQRIYRITLLGGIVNALLLVAKFAAGLLGHSAAMVADAVHSLSDFLTDMVVLVMVRLSSRPADGDHRYGHGKYETMATSIIGLALFAVGVMLGWKGVMKIVAALQGQPQHSPGPIALVAALVSIVVKEGLYRITRRVARQVDSQALVANAWHHRSDALSSIATALGIGGAIFLGDDWALLDAIAAVAVSVMIAVAACRLLRRAAGELLEECLPPDVEEKIVQIALSEPLVHDIHNLHTRRIGNIFAIEMHLRLPGSLSLYEAHDHASRIEQLLRDEFGQSTHIMLHLEPDK